MKTKAKAIHPAHALGLLAAGAVLLACMAALRALF